MRKIFLFAIVSVSALSIFACKKEQVDLQIPDREEMTFSAFVSPTGASTKSGFVEKTALAETSWGDLHKTDSPTTTSRKIYVSAYVASTQQIVVPGGSRQYDDVSDAQNYFEGRVFSKSGSTDNWKADPAIYWPISAKIDFLAVSVDTARTEHNRLDLEWSQYNVANKATLAVDESYMYDDILYSGVQGATYSGGTSKGSVNMKFNHAQAWITLHLHMKDATQDGRVAVKRVIFQDCYNTGNLVLCQDPTLNEEPKVKAEWTFRYDVKNDLAVRDNNEAADKVYGSLNTSTPNSYSLNNPLMSKGTKFTKKQTLDLLLPPQDEPAIIIEYYFDGFPNLFRCRCTPKSAQQWNMGKHYTYDIQFNVHEMVVVPSVNKWTDAVPEGDYQIEFETT